MRDEHAWQRHFVDAIWSTEGETCIPGLAGPIAAQVSTTVYRNNILEGFRETLQDLYGAIHLLIGADCFRQVAYAYAHEVPSRQGDLNRYGCTFPEFLGRYPATAGLPYLPDMARLEWACHEAYLAADAPPATGLHPSVRLLESNYPLMALWNLCQNPESAESLDLDALGGDRVLVARPDEEVLMRSVSPAESTWYRVLLSTGSPESAAASARRAENECDPIAFLEMAANQGLWIQRH